MRALARNPLWSFACGFPKLLTDELIQVSHWVHAVHHARDHTHGLLHTVHHCLLHRLRGWQPYVHSTIAMRQCIMNYELNDIVAVDCSTNPLGYAPCNVLEPLRFHSIDSPLHARTAFRVRTRMKIQRRTTTSRSEKLDCGVTAT